MKEIGLIAFVIIIGGGIALLSSCERAVDAIPKFAIGDKVYTVMGNHQGQIISGGCRRTCFYSVRVLDISPDTITLREFEIKKEES